MPATHVAEVDPNEDLYFLCGDLYLENPRDFLDPAELWTFLKLGPYMRELGTRQEVSTLLHTGLAS
jgi:hypothetical protein